MKPEQNALNRIKIIQSMTDEQQEAMDFAVVAAKKRAYSRGIAEGWEERPNVIRRFADWSYSAVAVTALSSAALTALGGFAILPFILMATSTNTMGEAFTVTGLMIVTPILGLLSAWTQVSLLERHKRWALNEVPFDNELIFEDEFGYFE